MRKKIIKKFWDMEIIGNRRKKKVYCNILHFICVFFHCSDSKETSIRKKMKKEKQGQWPYLSHSQPFKAMFIDYFSSRKENSSF